MPARSNIEFGSFLKARRQEVDPPADVRAASIGVRRVRGLRREEVARLAGVSPDYYARLEQGRQRNVSASVLSALASALRLSETQRAHLFALAEAAQTGAANYPAQSARRGLIKLLETVGNAPAVVVGRGTDILAVNDAARVVIDDFPALPGNERNVVRWFVLSPNSLRFDDWEADARQLIGMLRVDHARYPGDPRLSALVAELEQRSGFFRAVWAEHHVAEVPERKTIRHPEAGTLQFEVIVVTPYSDRDQGVHLFMPVSGTGTAEAVAELIAQSRRRPVG